MMKKHPFTLSILMAFVLAGYTVNLPAADDGLGEISVLANADGTFSITSITPNPVMERAGSVLVTVSRIGNTDDSPATINYATSNGSATAGEDYTDTNGSLVWAQDDTDTFKAFPVMIADNAASEQDETFTVTITPDASEVIGINSGEVTIIGTPSFTFDPSLYNVSEDGGSVTVFVERVNIDDGAISVDYTTTDGTAVAGEDYITTSGTLNWGAAEQGSMPINIPILADVDDLGPEVFTVDLMDCANCAVIVAQATVTISESAPPETTPGTLAFDPIAILVSEAAGNASVVVTRTDGTDGAVTIDWTTVGSSATSLIDFTAVSGTQSWADGVGGAKLISVPIIDDVLVEPTETFTVMFVVDSETGTQGLPTIGASPATVSIVDDELLTSLTLTKSANTETYSAIDDVVIYSYLVTSSGTGIVDGPITVADDKETVTCPSVSTVGNADNNLDPRESLTCTATHIVVQADIDATSITNTATASGDAGVTVSNEDMLTVNYQSIFKDGFEGQ